MSCDKLVFDLAQEIEGTPNIFVKKDWLNILDNQNGNYGANQSVVDTSQLSNSNKYLSYREAYLSTPLLLTLTSDAAGFAPTVDATNVDYSLGLKNWFGQIIHSYTLDYNGTTIIQQTPFINMWNSFKLMTSLSWSDIETTGSTIGFYPDDPLSWSYSNVDSPSGIGVCNNTDFSATVFGITSFATLNNYKSANGNLGFMKRQTYINYDADGSSGSGTYGANNLSQVYAANLWKSHISRKVNGANGSFQISVRATIYLKHIHSFFQMVPLLKGVYMKMTLNLNNSSCAFSSAGGANTNLNLVSTNVPVGGIQPIMIASKRTNNGGSLGLVAGNYVVSLSVGNICLEPTQRGLASVDVGKVGNNIFLYVPAYTFNPVFEQAYLSSPIKNIVYTDVYQYQVLNVPATQTFNNLLTNGLANVKSVLILPFYTSIVPGGAGVLSQPVYQSPFDVAGSGPTSPLCLITNFNVVVSGQNAIYNTQRYSFEQFNNQLYGVNAVNGGMTDGLTSGLINQLGFEMAYSYYYVDVSRCLPVEESVPKSIQIVGQNASQQPVNLWCFVEYGMTVSIDVLTGARV
jgi:hypothetical protein